MSKIIIGSARINENGTATGGKAGDQTGKEVALEPFYAHENGWNVLRPKSEDVAAKLAKAMTDACANSRIGYCQTHRGNVLNQQAKYGSLAKITEKTEADCSSLVRACCIEAGFDPGNFTTAGEAATLEKSGKFEKRFSLGSASDLRTGDVLVTKTKGHTAIVTTGAVVEPEPVEGIFEYVVKPGDSLSKIAKAYGTTYQKLSEYNGLPNPSLIHVGQVIRIPLPESNVTYFPAATSYTGVSIVSGLNSIGENSDYSYRKQIAKVNNIVNYSGTAAQNKEMLELLKKGKLIRP